MKYSKRKYVGTFYKEQKQIKNTVDYNDISKATYAIGTVLEWKHCGKCFRGEVISVGRMMQEFMYTFKYEIKVKGLDKSVIMYDTVLPDKFSNIDDTKTRTSKSRVLKGNYVYVILPGSAENPKKPYIREGRVIEVDSNYAFVSKNWTSTDFILEDGTHLSNDACESCYQDKELAEKNLQYIFDLRAKRDTLYADGQDWDSLSPLYDVQVADVGADFGDKFTLETVDGDFDGELKYYNYNKLAGIVPRTVPYHYTGGIAIPAFEIGFLGKSENYRGTIHAYKPVVKVVNGTGMQDMSLF